MREDVQWQSAEKKWGTCDNTLYCDKSLIVSQCNGKEFKQRLAQECEVLAQKISHQVERNHEELKSINLKTQLRLFDGDIQKKDPEFFIPIAYPQASKVNHKTYETSSDNKDENQNDC